MMSPDLLKREVKELAKAIRIKPKEIHIRRMKRKLASCSSKGRLTFDTSLLSKDPVQRYQVILHELLHLRYPNHGKMFNAVLKAHLKNSLATLAKGNFLEGLQRY